MIYKFMNTTYFLLIMQFRLSFHKRKQPFGNNINSFLSETSLWKPLNQLAIETQQSCSRNNYSKYWALLIKYLMKAILWKKKHKTFIQLFGIVFYCILNIREKCKDFSNLFLAWFNNFTIFNACYIFCWVNCEILGINTIFIVCIDLLSKDSELWIKIHFSHELKDCGILLKEEVWN